MFTLGTADGIGLQFADSGALQSIRIARHGKSLTISEDLPVLQSQRPTTVFPQGELPQAKSLALEIWGRGCVQTIAGGQRTWEVFQSRGDARQASVAWMRVGYRLAQPVSWNLSVSDCIATVQQGNGWVIVQCAGETAVRITTGHPLSYTTSSKGTEITGVTVTAQLPEGDSQVEMFVESRPLYNVADMVVLCLPQQLPEAAVVATCGRGKPANSGKYLPVIDVTLPPFDSAEFATNNQQLQNKVQELQQVEKEMMQLSLPGAVSKVPELLLPGGSTARSGDKLKELAQREQHLSQEVVTLQGKALTFAAWQRRWERVIRLVNSLLPAHMVCLYPLPPELLAAIAPGAGRTFFFWDDFKPQIAEWEKALAAKSPGKTASVVYFHDLEQLAKSAWDRLTGQKYPGAFTIPDDPRYYALGVRRALQIGKPLLPKGRAGDKVSLEAATDLVNRDAAAEEAVIVEADGSLASLAAALYADTLNAPLYVHPATSPEPVVRQLAAIQQAIEREEMAKQSSAAYTYIGEHKTQFLQDAKVAPDLKQLAASVAVLELPRAVPTPYSPQVFAQMLLTYVQAKEQGIASGYRYDEATWQKDTQELTALVTARVDGLIRAKLLRKQKATVFTLGLPYTFVEGWADKTLGHVLAEPCITVLRQVMSQALTPPAASFTLVLDPGFFRAAESPEITRRLRGGRVYPLYLRDSAASPAALQSYPSLLPVEAILLDLPGDEGSLFFIDKSRRMRPFSAAEIELTCEFAYAPLVFSQAAFSWLSVGAAFLRAGAGGYVGTLWSVESEPATEMALRTLGTGPAEQTGGGVLVIDPMTRRAYIHLGLSTQGGRAAAEPQSRIPNVAARQALYGAMLALAASGLHEQSEPLFRQWLALGEEDLSAAGEDRQALKDELDVEEREYHRQVQVGKEKRANGGAALAEAEIEEGEDDLILA